MKAHLKQLYFILIVVCGVFAIFGLFSLISFLQTTGYGIYIPTQGTIVPHEVREAYTLKTIVAIVSFVICVSSLVALHFDKIRSFKKNHLISIALSSATILISLVNMYLINNIGWIENHVNTFDKKYYEYVFYQMQESALLSAFVPIIIVACVVLVGAIYNYSKERKEASNPINIKKLLTVVGICVVVAIIIIIVVLICTGKLSSFEYTANSENTITITKYKGNRSTVKIPEKIGGKTVVRIAEHAFENSKVKNVQLPSTITSIGVRAFAKTDITSITLPESLTYIYCNAFDECDSLKEIIFLDPYNWKYFDSFEYKNVNLTDKEDNVFILDTFSNRQFSKKE